MKKKVIKGDAFIFPDSACKLSEFSQQDWIVENLSRLAGIEVDENEWMIQLWIISEECGNWQDYFAGFQEILGIREEDFRNSCKSYREMRLLGYFPRFFPSRIFEGKKEGDTIIIDCPEYKVLIELTCKQLNYMYKNLGRFKKALYCKKIESRI